MEKLKKRHNPLLLELSFNAIRQFRTTAIVYLGMCVLHLLLLALAIFQIVNPTATAAIMQGFPFVLVFTILAGGYLCFLLFGVLAHGKGVLLNFWGHLLLFFDGCSGLLIELSMKCYANEGWCQNEIKLQVSVGVVAGILLLLCMVLRAYFYYPYHDVGHFLSMDAGLATPLLYCYKVAVSLLGNVATSDKRVPVLLVCTFAAFLLNYNNYYKNAVSKCFWNTFYSICMWTSLLMYLVPNFPWQLQQGNSDTLLSSVWLYSTPFVIYLTISLGDYSSWEKFFQQHKINDEQLLYDVVSKVTVVLLRIKKSELKASNSEYKKLLGCIREHCKRCNFSDCCYKSAEVSIECEEDERLELKRLNKNVQLCLQSADKMIVRFQNREPENLQALLFEANYSFDALRLKQKALFLYNERSEEHLGAWHEYALHYLRRKVDLENNVHEQVNQQLNDQMLSQFQHNIEISASMLSQFWYLLSDPKCNTKKLYDLANVIFPLKIEVDAMWSRIQPIRNIQSYNLYAKYLIELFNDKETGLKLLEQAKKIDQEVRNRKEITIGLERNNVIADQHGVIFLELDESKSGTMYQVNLAAERIFGYNKDELLNRKVNDIMPKTYSNIHDQILENYALTNKAVMMNKERLIWGKSKSGYLFPFTILIKPVKNLFSEKTEIFASIRREPWLKEIGVIVLSSDLVVTDVSSSMLNIYSSLTSRAINKRKINIVELIPAFLTLKAQCESNRTASIEVERALVVDGVTHTQVVVFSLVVQPINITFAGCIGYLLKFSRTNHYEDREGANQNVVPCKFEMNLLMMQDELVEELKLVPTVIGAINIEGRYAGRISQQLSSMLAKKSKVEHRASASQVIYGADIKSKRLVENQLRDVHSESNNSEMFERQESSPHEEEAVGSGVLIKPGQLASLLSKPTNNKSIQSMKLVTLAVLLTSCAIIGVQYYTIVAFRAELEGQFVQMKGLKRLTSSILYMKQHVLSAMVAAPSLDELAAFIGQIDDLDALSKNLSFSLNTSLHYFDGSSQNMMMGFALSKLISECNSISNTLEKLLVANDSVAFVNYNSLNELIGSAYQQSQLNVDAINASISYHFQSTILFLCSSLPLLLVFVGINNLLLSRVLQKKTEVLEIFFEIPRKTCRNLQKDCEKFIQRFANSQENNMDAQSEMDYEDQIEESIDSEKQSKKKKRSIEGEDNTRVNFLAATLVFLVVLSLFPLIAMTHFQFQRPLLYSYNTVMGLLSEFEPGLIRTLNCINSLLLTPKVPILNSDGTFQQSQEKLVTSLRLLKETDSSYNTVHLTMMQQFYLIRTFLDDAFCSGYDAIMFGNICDDQSNCSSALQSGLNLHYSLYIYYIEDKLTNFTNYTAYNNATLYEQLISSETLRLECNIILTVDVMQAATKKWIRKLTDLLSDSIDRTLQFREIIMFAMMLTLIGVNFLAYLLGWIRFYSSLQAKIVATEYILTFIPLTEINKSSRILSYLRKKMTEKKQLEH